MVSYTKASFFEDLVEYGKTTIAKPIGISLSWWEECLEKKNKKKMWDGKRRRGNVGNKDVNAKRWPSNEMSSYTCENERIVYYLRWGVRFEKTSSLDPILREALDMLPSYFQMEVNKRKVQEVLLVVEQVKDQTSHMVMSDEMKEVNMDEEAKMVKPCFISKSLSSKQRTTLVQLLRKFQNVFT